MGTDDLPERAFHQGLIKLAAAHVHLDRGNVVGFVKNLTGARSRLADAVAGEAEDAGLDLPALLAMIDDRLVGATASSDTLGDPAGDGLEIRLPRRP